MPSESNFADLHHRAVAWAERESARIIQSGDMLTEPGMEIARRGGVRHPERVRVLFASSVPFSEDAVLRAAAERVGMIVENTAGMTLDYGVFIREDQRQNLKLLAHELRHVTQYQSD